MRFKICLFMTIFLCLFMTSSSVSVSGAEVYTPVSEVMDLKIDGSTPTYVNLTKKYDCITHVTLMFSYNDTYYIGEEFGEGIVLTNGLQFLYKGNDLFAGNVTKNEQFYKFFEETEHFVDDRSPKHTHIVAHIEFNHLFGFCLQISSLSDFQVLVQDDLTTNTHDLDVFKLVIAGYTVAEVADNRQAPPNIFTDIQDFAVEFIKEPLWWVWILMPAAAMVAIVKWYS